MDLDGAEARERERGSVEPLTRQTPFGPGVHGADDGVAVAQGVGSVPPRWLHVVDRAEVLTGVAPARVDRGADDPSGPRRLRSEPRPSSARRAPPTAHPSDSDHAGRHRALPAPLHPDPPWCELQTASQESAPRDFLSVKLPDRPCLSNVNVGWISIPWRWPPSRISSSGTGSSTWTWTRIGLSADHGWCGGSSGRASAIVAISSASRQAASCAASSPCSGGSCFRAAAVAVARSDQALRGPASAAMTAALPWRRGK